MTLRTDVQGTVAVITGTSRGIGFAIARHFLAHGAQVVISGIDAEETTSAANALKREFGEDQVASYAGDVSQTETAETLVAFAHDQFRRIDSLVCNAGIDIIKPATDYSVDEWDRILAVNLRGVFLPAQKVASGWIGAGKRGGSITLTSSIAAKAGIAGLAPYGASKGAIDQLVRNLAIEWARHGIRVNAIAPGYVENIMAGVTNVHANPETEARIRTFTPMGRRATVDEIAAPFVFLASPAAAYITGAVLAVDGGYTAQ